MQGPSLDPGGTTAHPDPLHRAQRAGNPGQHWSLGAGFWLVFPKGNGNLLPAHDFLQDTNSSCKRGMEQRLLWRPGAQSKKRKLRCWDAVYPLPLKHHNTKVLMLRDVPRKALQYPVLLTDLPVLLAWLYQSRTCLCRTSRIQPLETTPGPLWFLMQKIPMATEGPVLAMATHPG